MFESVCTWIHESFRKGACVIFGDEDALCVGHNVLQTLTRLPRVVAT